MSFSFSRLFSDDPDESLKPPSGVPVRRYLLPFEPRFLPRSPRPSSVALSYTPTLNRHFTRSVVNDSSSLEPSDLNLELNVSLGKSCPFDESVIPLSESSSPRARNPYFDKLKSRISRHELEFALSRIEILSNVSVRIPKPSERPSRLKPGEVAFNVLSFQLGITFQVPNFLRCILCEMRVAPVQLHPHIFEFISSCHDFWVAQG